jgi:hypothetical protein
MLGIGSLTPKIWLPLFGLVALAVVLGAAGMWRRGPRASDSASSASLTVLISGDTAAWIVPCGCTANQSGGLPRRGTLLSNLRLKGPVIYVDAGGAPGGTSPYQRVKFEAVLKGELAMDLAAHNLGGPEAALGIDYLRSTARELQVPFVSANLRDSSGDRVAEPVRIVQEGGRRVACMGVLSRRFAASGLQIDDPREALLQTIAATRGQYDSLVILAYMPEEELQQLATDLPEADAIVGGPTGQSLAPRKVGPTLLASATNKGKFLIQLQAPPVGQTSGWTGQVVELGTEFADDADQQANVQKYLDVLEAKDFPAQDTGFAPVMPAHLPASYRLAGSSACQACHQADCTAWQGSHHATAWQTLVGRRYHVDSYCQQCHTTGFGMPNGFHSRAVSRDAVGVGCESCHGPSAAHIRDPKVQTTFAAKDQCSRCHDRENSPKYIYADFWPKIRHGAAKASKPSATDKIPGKQ